MPSINGGMKLVKYSLFLFNLVFVIFGVVLIWVGFNAKYEFTKLFKDLLNGNDGGHSIPPNILIAAGFIMFIIAFLGCCGAVTENHCMMMLYSVLIGMILVIQIGAGIAAYAFESDIENAMGEGLNGTMQSYYSKNTSDPMHNQTVRAWNMLQNTYHCCGLHNYTDWATVEDRPDKGYVPTFCCIGGSHDGCTDSISNSTTEADAAKLIYTEGCLAKAIEQASINHMGTLGIVFAVVQVLGIICACMMARSIRFSYETV